MKLKKFLATILLILALSCFAAVIKLTVFDRQKPASSSLRVDSYPPTVVFLNDQNVGKTPYLGENLPAGEHKLKLVSTGGVAGSFINWQTKVKLTSGTLTYVSRILGSNDDLSGGQMLTLEKLDSDDAQLAVVSNPDMAEVVVDGQEEGRASIVLTHLVPGDHEIVVTLPGFSDQVIQGRTTRGFRLNIIAKLARLNLLAAPAIPSASPSAQVASPSAQMAKPYVVIKSTETGFLRVRFAPNLSATESTRVKPGEKYPLLKESPGWSQIKLPSLSGWVSDSYVEKVK